MPKNIVIFSDGTGQEGGEGHNSNVYKLFNAIEDRSPTQIAFYDRGLGTGIRKITGQVSGMGISHNIRECYEFLLENFRAGDQIFLLGFSRGATTMRSLSNFIHIFGILPSSRPELIKKAWKIYKTEDPDRRKEKADGFIEKHHTMWTKVKFLGVWDTVAALGVPFKRLDKWIDKVPWFRHKFQDLSLSESVDVGCHALSIDDERKTFHPTYWEGEPRKEQTVKQVWFSGMHSDVGGGYREQGLSDIALEWIVENAVAQGLRIYDKNTVKTNPDANGKMHDSRSGAGRFFRQEQRQWKSASDAGLGKPVVHSSVLERNVQTNKKYDPWILRLEYEVEPWEKLTKNDAGGIAVGMAGPVTKDPIPSSAKVPKESKDPGVV